MIDGQEKELGQSHYQFDEGDISYCNEIGEGGQLNAVNSFSSSGRSSIECFNCGKLGHISRFCRNKKKPPRKRAIVVVRKTVSPTLDQTIILVIKRRAKQNPSQCREKSKLAGGVYA